MPRARPSFLAPLGYVSFGKFCQHLFHRAVNRFAGELHQHIVQLGVSFADAAVQPPDIAPVESDCLLHQSLSGGIDQARFNGDKCAFAG